MLNFPSACKFKFSLENNYFYILYLIFINEWLCHIPGLNSFYAGCEKLIITIIVFLMFIYVIRSRYSLGKLILVFCFMLTGICTYFRTNVIWIFYLLYLALLSNNVDMRYLLIKIRKLMRLIWHVNFLVFIFQYIFSIGVLPVVLSRGMTRYCISFSGPTGAAAFWTIYMLVVFVLDERKNGREIIQYGLMTLVTYYFTRSEITFLGLVPYGIMLFNKKNSNGQIIRFLTRWGSFIFAFFSIFTMFYYRKSAFLQTINVFFTGRLSMLVKGYEYYGITILGQKVNLPAWVEMNGSFELISIDNAFASIMINYGFIYLIPFIVLPIISVKKMSTNECIAIMVYEILLFVVEGILSPLFVAPFLILVKRLNQNSNKVYTLER